MITVSATIKKPVADVWSHWTTPAHIIHWNYASDDWQTTYADNDLRPGGRFVSRMEAKDGSMGFDFGGTYSAIEEHKLIEYRMDDDRRVVIKFEEKNGSTLVTESFDPENVYPEDFQKAGWQSILDNFRLYAESKDPADLLTFSIFINKPPQVVAEILTSQETYRRWTSAFNPSSRYRGSWEKGSKIVFIGEDSDGNTGGMVSRIKENILGVFISIEHLGILKGDDEILEGPEVETWKGSLESYRFREENGGTTFNVEIDSNPEFRSYFENTWPEALRLLKGVCEK